NVISIQLHAVDQEEGLAQDGRSPLVAVNERMVPGQPECQARRKAGQVRGRIAIHVQLLRAGESGLKQGLVADAAVAAMLGDLAAVDGDGQGALHPDDHRYCASLWSRVR